MDITDATLEELQTVLDRRNKMVMQRRNFLERAEKLERKIDAIDAALDERECRTQ